MPSATDFYGSGGRFLNAADLKPLGQRRTAVITDVTEETLIGSSQRPENKLALHLSSKDGRPWPKAVTLNRGNMLQMVTAFGDEYRDWLRCTVEIWSENVQFGNRIVPGIKVVGIRRNGPPATRTAPPVDNPEPEHDPDPDPDSDIPEDEADPNAPPF